MREEPFYTSTDITEQLEKSYRHGVHQISAVTYQISENLEARFWNTMQDSI